MRKTPSRARYVFYITFSTYLTTLQRAPKVMDATRVADGKQVYIKQVETGDNESQIALMFSSEPLRDNPANHCVPISSIFQDDEDPKISYLVMPLLRSMEDPHFQFVNDIVELMDQYLEVCPSRQTSPS